MKCNVPENLINRGIARGAVVRSMAGHDKHELFIVVKADNGAAMLADGRNRPHSQPKRKNVRHLLLISQLPDPDILDRIDRLGDAGQRDAALRKLLKEFT